MTAPRRRRRALLLLLLFASALPSLVSTGISISLFVDYAALDSYAYAAPPPLDVAVEPSLVMTAANLLPGDEIDGEFTVRNAGAMSLRYAVDVKASDPDGRALRDALNIRIWEARGTCAAALGVPFYVGRLSGARVGDPTPGSQVSDRRLDPGEAETLCVRLALPVGTPNRYHAAQTVVTFVVSAEADEVGQ